MRDGVVGKSKRAGGRSRGGSAQAAGAAARDDRIADAKRKVLARLADMPDPESILVSLVNELVNLQKQADLWKERGSDLESLHALLQRYIEFPSDHVRLDPRTYAEALASAQALSALVGVEVGNREAAERRRDELEVAVAQEMARRKQTDPGARPTIRREVVHDRKTMLERAAENLPPLSKSPWLPYFIYRCAFLHLGPDEMATIEALASESYGGQAFALGANKSYFDDSTAARRRWTRALDELGLGDER